MKYYIKYENAVYQVRRIAESGTVLPTAVFESEKEAVEYAYEFQKEFPGQGVYVDKLQHADDIIEEDSNA